MFFTIFVIACSWEAVLGELVAYMDWVFFDNHDMKKATLATKNQLRMINCFGLFQEKCIQLPQINRDALNDIKRQNPDSESEDEQPKSGKKQRPLTRDPTSAIIDNSPMSLTFDVAMTESKSSSAATMPALNAPGTSDEEHGLPSKKPRIEPGSHGPPPPPPEMDVVVAALPL